ncbi:MAG: type I polyketide synthase, partial [Nonomuraea sp.]|nr:type I polyketide synthase [Nonomuraea sp.]
MGAEEKLRDYLRRATAELLETRAQLEQALVDEPIAIVGMACRFPGGVRSPDDLWRLVAGGGSGITAAPEGRGWEESWPGGYLEDAADFDAGFFEISPREALAMDPQHRLLLEIAWEAIESAGIPADALRGTSTGVYVGMMAGDYATRIAAHGTGGFDGFFLNGNGGSVASGRIAYTLGLHGPAVTIDTACSSALVALHDACQALRRGDCSTALVGAVSVMSTPTLLVEFRRQGGLAPDGRCKPFAAAADGTSFGEGVAMLLVERLSDARRNGHQVLAVVRGSAVNQDGASNGLTAPNGAAQQQVIQQALAAARLTPDQVDALEAHGTGTTLGDPIEGQALLAVHGGRRPEGRPLLVGSVKSNLGHTQAVAGLAGLIKMVLAMRHGVLPPSLGIDAPTPHVDWSAGGLRLLTEQTPWPETGEPRRAGVSSFSLSGTNAHVVIEQPPDEEPAAPGIPPAAVPWVLSAKSPAALRAQAARLLARLDETPVEDADVAYSLATGRTTLRFRAVVVGADRPALVAGLTTLSAGEPAANLAQGVAPAAGRPGAVFVFPGQGHQWAGMGAELMDSSPVFAARVRDCEAAFAPYLDWSVSDVLAGRPGARGLDDDEVVHPALFTTMVSLAALWQSYGVRPIAVVGHSQGEIAAACVAGALSLADAARVVALRSTLIRDHLTGHGGMASVLRPAAEVERLIARWPGRLAIGALNGPASTAVSGDLDALEELLVACAADGIQAQRIPIGYAAHSFHVDRIEDGLRDTLGVIEPGELAIPFYSTATGAPVTGRELTARYWFENLRRPVDFAGAVRVLLADGHRAFAECSAHPVLTYGVAELAEDAGVEAAVTGTLRRDDGGLARFLTSLGDLHVKGGHVDWAAAFAGSGARRVPLPSYAFERARYWIEAAPAAAGDVRAAGLATADHPLLGAAVEVASGDGVLLVGRVSAREHPWIADHVVAGTVLLPATAVVELAAHAAARAGSGGMEELILHAPLAFGEEDDLTLQLEVRQAEDGRRALTLFARTADGPWTRHATGVLMADPADGDEGSPASWPPAGAEPVDVAGLYERLADVGYQYGPVFRGLRRLWRRDDELFAEVMLPEPAVPAGYGVHPALLDAALHALPAQALMDGADGELLLPFAWRGVAVRPATGTALRVHLVRRGSDEIELRASDDAGVPVVSVRSLSLRPIPVEQLRTPSNRDSLFVLDWPVAASGRSSTPERCAVLGDGP